MRILLSGATGQLGRALAATLPRIGDVSAPPRASFDLQRETSIRTTLDETRPDLIVNAAAYTAVDKAEGEPDIAMAVNAKAPGVMAEWAAENGAAILHYSTDYVFDGTGCAPWKEDDPTNPINVYGESKNAGEVAVKASGASHLIIRTSWVYDGWGANFLRTMLHLARKRKNLQIVADQIGAPTPAWWLAETSTNIISHTEKNGGFCDEMSGILHAAPAGRTSWFGFASAIFDGAQARSIPLAVETVEPISTENYPTPAARPRNSVFCIDRLRQTYNVTPPDWHDALTPVLDEIAGSDL